MRQWEQERGGKEKRREKRIKRKQKEKEENTATENIVSKLKNMLWDIWALENDQLTWSFAKSGDKTGSKWKIMSHHCDDRDIVKAEWGEKINKQAAPQEKRWENWTFFKCYISGESGCFSLKFQASEFIIREIVQAYPQHNSLIISEMDELAGKNHCLVLPQVCTDGRVPGRRW